MYVILFAVVGFIGILGLVLYSHIKNDIKPKAAYQRSLRKRERAGDEPNPVA